MSIIILTECVSIEDERELYYTEHNVLPNNIGVHNTILNFTLSEKKLYQMVQLCSKRRM